MKKVLITFIEFIITMTLIGFVFLSLMHYFPNFSSILNFLMLACAYIGGHVVVGLNFGIDDDDEDD